MSMDRCRIHPSSWLLVVAGILLSSGCKKGAGTAETDANATSPGEAGVDTTTATSSESLATLAPTFDSGMWLTTHARDLTQANDPKAPGFYLSDGTAWQGRGAVVHDTRACDNCSYISVPNTAEAFKRIDVLVDVWHANYIRLVTESYTSAQQGNVPARGSWQSLLYDPAYLNALKQIVDYIGTKHNVYVHISMWRDASITQEGFLWPTVDSMTAPGTLCDTPAFQTTPTSTCTWRKLAQTFAAYPYVIYGIDGEPAFNDDGSADNEVWQRMNANVQAIRDVENAGHTPHHVVLVQGTRNWARSLTYYAHTDANGSAVMHPITAGGGENVGYETHPYNGVADFQNVFLDTANYLPVVVGEFGPVYMTLADCDALVSAADTRKLPWTTWSFHPLCGPLSMITEQGSTCDGTGAASIAANAWGAWVQNKLQSNVTPATNVALHRTTSQSSTYSGADASRAVDGVTVGTWANSGTTHTALTDANPWWEVDLGSIRLIDQINLYNRMDCCQYRIVGAVVFMSNTAFTTDNPQALATQSGVTMLRLASFAQGAKASVLLPANQSARYVRVALPGTGRILSLSEVEVMGR